MNWLKQHIYKQVSIAPLVTFRVLFGLIMFISIVRFAYNGWIDQLYVEPSFFFTYLWLDWIKPLDSVGMYTVFTCIGVSALCISAGFFYRVASILFFVLFTYVELIDKTNYLNHYYFVSIVGFLMMMLPAGRFFSIDVLFNPRLRLTTVPAWTINSIRLQLALVYFFAGLAKINSDWLLRAMPLKIWVAGKSHIPVIGKLFNYSWAPFLLSWAGMLYDLCIPFLLSFRRTRMLAYLAVVVFHLLTAALFGIGMFPYIMILSTLIFFPSKYHERVLQWLGAYRHPTVLKARTPRPATSLVLTVLAIHFVIQAALPMRHIAYQEDLFWTEKGYRFSWRVMLMEKAGYAEFVVRDPASGRTELVRNDDYLTPYQEKMMSTQPDMILQYAHYIADDFRKKGYSEPVVSVHSAVSLNGRRSRPLIRPDVDLACVTRSDSYSNWVTTIELE